MRWITGIEVRGFRNIERLSLDLTPQDGRPFVHLIVTGPNGSGKTGFLEALARRLEHPLTAEQYQEGVEGRLGAGRRSRRLLSLSPVWLRLAVTGVNGATSTEGLVDAGGARVSVWGRHPKALRLSIPPPCATLRPGAGRRPAWTTTRPSSKTL